MTWQEAFSIAAASAGFASAAWFGLGAVFMTSSKIAIIADAPWKSARDTAYAIASQSAQYLAGALLLLASFGLQIAAVEAASTTLPTHRLIPTNIFGFASCLALAFLCAGLPIYATRYSLLRRKLQHLAAPEPDTQA